MERVMITAELPAVLQNTECPFFPGLGDLVSRLPKATLYSTTLLRCSSVSVAANCPSWRSLKVILMEQETGTAMADQLLP